MPPRGVSKGSKGGTSRERAEEMATSTVNEERSEAGESKRKAKKKKSSSRSGGGKKAARKSAARKSAARKGASRKSAGGRKSAARKAARKSTKKAARKTSARGASKAARKTSARKSKSTPRRRTSTPAAVAGYPAITVPMGQMFGLPVGLTFFTRAWGEPTLLKLAYAFEQATGARTPPRFRPTVELA